MIKKIKNKITSLYIKLMLTDQQVIELRWKSAFGRKPDLRNPKTFNEKLTWIICNYRNQLYELCSDKVEVRKYVESKGLSDILIKKHAVYTSIDEIDIDKLPESFVIKTTHASGGVVVIKDKRSADLIEMKKVLAKSMKQNLYKSAREWQYRNLTPRIIAEDYIKSAHEKSLKDYKIFCFDGKPRFIYVATDTIKGGDYAVDFYDTEWNHLEAQRVGHSRSNGVKRPANLEEMLRIAEILSEGFIHVRVDLYSVDGKIYFGELTFTTAAGTGTFIDEKWDLEFGKYMRLPIINYETRKA